MNLFEGFPFKGDENLTGFVESWPFSAGPRNVIREDVVRAIPVHDSLSSFGSLGACAVGVFVEFGGAHEVNLGEHTK